MVATTAISIVAFAIPVIVVITMQSQLRSQSQFKTLEIAIDNESGGSKSDKWSKFFLLLSLYLSDLVLVYAILPIAIRVFFHDFSNF